MVSLWLPWQGLLAFWLALAISCWNWKRQDSKQLAPENKAVTKSIAAICVKILTYPYRKPNLAQVLPEEVSDLLVVLGRLELRPSMPFAMEHIHGRLHLRSLQSR